MLLCRAFGLSGTCWEVHFLKNIEVMLLQVLLSPAKEPYLVENQWNFLHEWPWVPLEWEHFSSLLYPEDRTQHRGLISESRLMEPRWLLECNFIKFLLSYHSVHLKSCILWSCLVFQFFIISLAGGLRAAWGVHGCYRSAAADGGETNPGLPGWLLSAMRGTRQLSAAGCSAILTVLFLKTLGDAEVLLAPLKGNWASLQLEETQSPLQMLQSALDPLLKRWWIFLWMYPLLCISLRKT